MRSRPPTTHAAPSRRRPPWRGDTGQTAVEYIGALVLVAALIASLTLGGIAARLGSGLQVAVCTITTSGCGGSAAAPGSTRAVDAAPATDSGTDDDDGFDLEWPPPASDSGPRRGAGSAFLDGLFAGDFDDTAPTSGGEAWSRSGGQMVSGLLIYGDVRDGGHAIGELWSTGGRDGWGDLLWSGAGLVPFAGDAAKGLRLGDDAIDATADAARAGDAARAADAARTTTRSVDDIVENGAVLSQRRLEHIVREHWPTSGVANKGRFGQDITARRLRGLLDDAVANGTHRPNTRGRPGTIFEYDFRSPIGVNGAGAATSRLRVAVDPAGDVVTAFPY